MPRKRTTPVDPDAAALGADDIPLSGMGGLKADPAPRKSTGRKPTGRPAGRPRTRTGPRTADGRVMSKAAMVDKVTADLYGAAALLPLAVRDPCVNVLFDPVDDAGTERVAAIIDRSVAMMARNTKVLETVAKVGLLADVITMIGLIAPIGVAVWAAHGPGGHGHQDVPVGHDAATYPALR